jgi:hypothetical protein
MNRFRQAENRFQGSLKDLQTRALAGRYDNPFCPTGSTDIGWWNSFLAINSWAPDLDPKTDFKKNRYMYPL